MYLKKDDLYYSVLYGSGVYSLSVDGTQDPITGERSAEFFNVVRFFQVPCTEKIFLQGLLEEL